METIVTHVHLKPGRSDWDAVMQERLAVARKLPGWIGGQLLRRVRTGTGGTLVARCRIRCSERRGASRQAVAESTGREGEGDAS
jgi:antibiotic biosynthesis monooxygenase (ABM) superfamily enzyme